MQDVEFTVENKKLWILQTRSGKRTAEAAIKIAVDMVKEKLIQKKEAILRIDPNTLDTLLHPTLDKKVKKKLLQRASCFTWCSIWKSSFYSGRGGKT